MIQKCSSRGLQCVTFTEEVHPDYCPYFLYNVFAGDTLSKITKPPLKCPLKKAVYVGSKYLVDFSPAALLPFDIKYKWLVLLHFFEKAGKLTWQDEEERLLPLGCWLMQITRTKATGRKGKGK